MSKSSFALYVIFGIIVGNLIWDRMHQVNSSEKTTIEAVSKEQQIVAEQVVAKICYIKDPRTGLCFAYYEGSQANGGSALAMIPAEAIPPELLIEAKVPDR